MEGYWIGIGAVLAAILVSRFVRMAYEHDRIIRRVDAFLTVWARYGEWPPECQSALDALLTDTGLPAQKTPPSSVGMDFGFGFIMEHVWNAMRGRRA
jgi:hypothetical protein